MILSVIEEGYRIPFIQQPPSMFFPNNRSALRQATFVTKSILQLLDSGRVTELSTPAYVNSPLSVATSASKRRLILDLSRLNCYVKTYHFKIDDWKIGLQYLSPRALLASFDLKSGYHHVDIAPECQKFLGFSWPMDGKVRFFVFNVLPFGLSSAPYIFTKVLKPLVAHWRSAGLLIAVYLDDGFAVFPDSLSPKANRLSGHIRSDLLKAGFVYNISKSSWEPSMQLDWLGMRWDTERGKLKVLDRRVSKIRSSIVTLLEPSAPLVIKDLHSLVGQIISLSPVIGNVSRLMTRCCQMKIAAAAHEKESLSLSLSCKSIQWDLDPRIHVAKAVLSD